jgi:hypothetical protein
MSIEPEHFPTKKEYTGPWLLDSKSLREFDILVDKHWVLLETRRKALLQADVDFEFKKYKRPYEELTEEETKRLRHIRDIHEFSKSVRLLQISSKDESTNRFEDFDSALRSRRMDSKNPTAFSLTLNSAEIKCSILLDSNRLRVEILPDHLVESQNLFIDIREWIEKHEPKWWQRIWNTLADKWYWFYAAVVVIFLALTFFAMSYQRQGITYDIRAQIQELLENGITDAEVPLALELLLRAQDLPFVFPSWLISFLVFSLIVCALIPIRPKIVLGIGMATRKIKMWRNWYWIVIAVLGFILANILAPIIVSYIT